MKRQLLEVSRTMILAVKIVKKKQKKKIKVLKIRTKFLPKNISNDISDSLVKKKSKHILTLDSTNIAIHVICYKY
jgi:hypothetical protein